MTSIVLGLHLSPQGLGAHLETVLDAPTLVDGLPVVPIEALVYLKLVAHRRRDQNEVIELIRCGADPVRCRAYLATHAPDLIDRSTRLVDAAESDD